jgi:predicted ester cyclase
VLADGDRVVVRGTDRATHRGDFMEFSATGREITMTWIESDSAALRNQLVSEPG